MFTCVYLIFLTYINFTPKKVNIGKHAQPRQTLS